MIWNKAERNLKKKNQEYKRRRLIDKIEKQNARKEKLEKEAIAKAILEADENENLSFYREVQANKPGSQAVDIDSDNQMMPLYEKLDDDPDDSDTYELLEGSTINFPDEDINDRSDQEVTQELPFNTPSVAEEKESVHYIVDIDKSAN